MRRSALVALGGLLGCLLGCRQILDLDGFENAPASSSTAGGVATGGSGGSGGTQPLDCGRFGAIADDFEDGLLDRTATRPGWIPVANTAAAVSEQSGVAYVELTPMVAEAYGRVGSTHAADLRGSAVTVRVAGVPSSGVSSAKVWLENDDGDAIALEARTSGELAGFTMVDGVATEVGQIPYVLSDHVHWQLAEQNGQVTWKTSPDRVTWTQHWSVGAGTLPFGLSNLRLFMDGYSQYNSTDNAIAEFDDVNDVNALESWCPASSFTDDFADGIKADAWLVESLGGCTVTENAAHELEFWWPGGSECSYRTATAFNLENSMVTVQVPRIIVQPQARIYLRASFDGGNFFELRQERGATVDEIRAIMRIDGNDNLVNSAPYDSSMHQWWRLREQGGTLYWQVSEKGSEWVDFAEASPGVPLSGVDIALGVVVVPGGRLGAMVFARYNLPPL